MLSTICLTGFALNNPYCRRDPDIVSDGLAAAAATDNLPAAIDDAPDDLYDSFGNYIGDQGK